MFVKLTAEEEATIRQRVARDRRHPEVARRDATIDVLVARAGDPIDLAKMGGRTKIEYSKVLGADQATWYLRATCTNHQEAMVSMRDVELLDDEELARARLDLKVAHDLGALIYANDD
ncbi:MAG: hypothetical protein K0U16_07195 [Gammaproteobacteria bacterium]|nr:hypothetical protein [Gammaproteobacteria bacterium]